MQSLGPGRDPGSFGFPLDPPRRSRSASDLSALRQNADPATMKAKPARKISPTNQQGMEAPFSASMPADQGEPCPPAPPRGPTAAIAYRPELCPSSSAN
jgi:hypothetical protein